MSASAQPHPIIDKPATAAICQAEYEIAQARHEDPQGRHYNDDRGQLGTGQQHTHRS